MTEAWADRGAHYAVSPLHRQGRFLIGTDLEYEGARAVRLELPMALILAVKPG